MASANRVLLGFISLIGWTVVLLPFLAGCSTVDICCNVLDISTTIRPDGSGTKRIAVAMDEKIYTLATLRGGDPFTDLRARAREAGPGARVEPYRRKGQVGITVSIDFPNLETLNRGIGTASFETVRARRIDWLMEQRFTFWSQIDTGRLPRHAVQSPLARVQRFDVVYSLTLPGEIISHNANEVRGNQLIWHLDSRGGTVYELRATSQRVKRESVTNFVIGGVLVSVLLIAGAVLFILSRRV